VVPSQGESLPQGAILRVCFSTSGGRQVEHYYRISGNGLVEVVRVEGTDVILQVEESEGPVLAVEHIALAPNEPVTATIHLRAGSRTFRVVDGTRHPVTGVRLTLTRPSDGSGWVHYLESNAAGECSIRGLALDKVFVNLFEFSFGVQPSALVDLGAEARDPIELVLAPSLTLRVQALERKQPVPNLEIRASDQQGVSFGLGAMTSNADAIASWGPVAKGDFRIEVRQPGYWPSDHLIHFAESSSPVPIQVRRLGNIELTVKNNYENPMPGVTVDLFSLDDQRWVSSWIESETVPAPEGGMRSNSEGRVRINGLPSGPYRWKATAPDAAAAEGEINLAPHATTTGVIAMP
jgi:hypothetical protein